jgi:hypothetical protein
MKMKKANLQDKSDKPARITFPTTILQTGKNTAGIQVPEEIIEQLGSGKRPLVRVTLKEYTYRSAVAAGSHVRLSPGACWIDRCEQEFPDRENVIGETGRHGW